jgi:hypothetical protein
MRDRQGYARMLTAGLSLALALFASGCLAAEGTEEDEAPKLAQEAASTASAVAVYAAPREASAAPAIDTQNLTDEDEAEAPATPPEDSEVDYDDTTAAHEQIGGQGHGDGVFLEPPPHPYTPPPQH